MDKYSSLYPTFINSKYVIPFFVTYIVISYPLNTFNMIVSVHCCQGWVCTYVCMPTMFANILVIMAMYTEMKTDDITHT